MLKNCNLMLTNKIPYANSRYVVETHGNSGNPAPIVNADFFIPDFNFGGARNIQITPRVYFHGFSPRSLNGFEVTFETGEIMTNITDIQGVYNELRRILNIVNKHPYSAESDDAEYALCTAINALESAIAYLPTEGKEDRKIKLNLLKKTITEIAEDGDGNIDLDKLTPRAREQLAMVLELVQE